MKRLIDANAIEAKIEKSFRKLVASQNKPELAAALSYVGDLIIEAPTADAVELVHGQWERFEEISGNIGVLCSACGWKDYHHGRFKGNLFNYCPHCGSKMDG